MGDKISTVVLNVDLDCPKCYKKIRKTLCKFCEIQSWSFDEKQKKVIISGPFDPECLIKRLYCKVGCKIIKGHQIIKPPPPKKPEPPKEPEPPKKPDSPKKPEPPKEPEPPKKPEPPKEPEPPKKPEPPKEPEPPPKKPPPPKDPEPPPPPAPEPVIVGPPGPICCCRPCYEGRPWDGHCTRWRGYYYDTCCKDCYEGRPWDGYCTRGGYESGCRFFSDEDSTCRTM